jgi:hypothetical protein
MSLGISAWNRIASSPLVSEMVLLKQAVSVVVLLLRSC